MSYPQQSAPTGAYGQSPSSQGGPRRSVGALSVESLPYSDASASVPSTAGGAYFSDASSALLTGSEDDGDCAELHGAW